jgi:hypothetical protein
MTDITHAMAAKSDQLNNVDLIGRDIIVNITGVDVKPKGSEQPVWVRYQGDENKPWKPCKSMLRVLAAAWGTESSLWVGKSLKLVRDENVTFGSEKTGGIRISHMSDIADELTVSIPVKRGRFAPYTVQPLIGHLTHQDKQEASEIAKKGTKELTKWWATLGIAGQRHFLSMKDELKRIAEDADAAEGA